MESEEIGRKFVEQLKIFRWARNKGNFWDDFSSIII